MDKVEIEVYVPTINRTYNIFVPLQSRLYEVMNLIAKAVSELSNGLFVASKDSILCSRLDGSAYNLNKTVREAGIENGAKIMLM